MYTKNLCNWIYWDFIKHPKKRTKHHLSTDYCKKKKHNTTKFFRCIHMDMFIDERWVTVINVLFLLLFPSFSLLKLLWPQMCLWHLILIFKLFCKSHRFIKKEILALFSSLTPRATNLLYCQIMVKKFSCKTYFSKHQNCVNIKEYQMPRSTITIIKSL